MLNAGAELLPAVFFIGRPGQRDCNLLCCRIVFRDAPVVGIGVKFPTEAVGSSAIHLFRSHASHYSIYGCYPVVVVAVQSDALMSLATVILIDDAYPRY